MIISMNYWIKFHGDGSPQCCREHAVTTETSSAIFCFRLPLVTNVGSSSREICRVPPSSRPAWPRCTRDTRCADSFQVKICLILASRGSRRRGTATTSSSPTRLDRSPYTRYRWAVRLERFSSPGPANLCDLLRLVLASSVPHSDTQTPLEQTRRTAQRGCDRKFNSNLCG